MTSVADPFSLDAAAVVAPSRDARSARLTFVAWIDDPLRDAGALLVRLAKVMAGVSSLWEALIVHDPAAPRVAERLAPWLKTPGVRLVTMPPGTSGSAAIREALRLAGGDVAIVLDAAMQRCPEALRDLLQGWEEGADAVRLCAVAEPVSSPWPSTAVFRAWTASGRLNGEWLGGIRLLSRAVLDGLLAAAESGVTEFTVWSVLTLPDRVLRPWSSLPSTTPAAATDPAARPGGDRHGIAAMSWLAPRLARRMAQHALAWRTQPIGRVAAVASLLVWLAGPIGKDAGFDGDARGEARVKPMQVSGTGFARGGERPGS